MLSFKDSRYFIRHFEDGSTDDLLAAFDSAGDPFFGRRGNYTRVGISGENSR